MDLYQIFGVESQLSGSSIDERKSVMDEKKVRDYGNMTMGEVIETVITDSKLAGTITYPLRTEGYHQASNLLYTDRLK